MKTSLKAPLAMTDWKTIKVPPEDKERADDYRPEDSTWGDVVLAGAERLNDHMDSNPPPGVDIGVDVDALAERIADRVEAEGGAGPDAIAREVSKQLDYVELSNRVAEELEGRMQ